ncbi:MAG: hypothetical protein ACXWP4_17775, partial [Polyangiales bacterium]
MLANADAEVEAEGIADADAKAASSADADASAAGDTDGAAEVDCAAIALNVSAPVSLANARSFSIEAASVS